jgi:hypothetical protein
LCVALARDLRNDPMMVADRRVRRRLRRQTSQEMEAPVAGEDAHQRRGSREE